VAERIELVVDPLAGDRVALDFPLAYDTPPTEARRRLGLGDFVDLTDPTVAKAVSLLEAARRTEEPRLRLTLLGGVGFRLLSASSNHPTFGLRRELHDIDLVCARKQYRAVHTFLTRLGPAAGSGLTFFETSGDRTFNALGAGLRYRYHTVFGEDRSQLRLGTVDLLGEEFRFCHSFELGPELERADPTPPTLSLELLLLTKLQFIRSIPATDQEQVRERVLAPFGKREVVIGPEEKDVKDILALVHDRPLGEDPGQISPERFRRWLDNDWGLWMTTRLNLAGVSRAPVLNRLPPVDARLIRERLAALLAVANESQPKRRFSFLQKEWWEPVDEGTFTDRAVSLSAKTGGPSEPVP
jgi:hypothetical protein